MLGKKGCSDKEILLQKFPCMYKENEEEDVGFGDEQGIEEDCCREINHKTRHNYFFENCCGGEEDSNGEMTLKLGK